MKKVEVHCKTKYSKDYDSIIDVENAIYNSRENGEKGIIFVDKESIYSFPKIEKTYLKLLSQDKLFVDYKIGYGVELNVFVEEKKCQIIILVKNQVGLSNLYKIMNKYNNIIEIKYILDNKEGLLLGLIYQENINLNIFDYVEINKNIEIDTNKLVVYSNIPNAFYDGDKLSLEVLQTYRNATFTKCRLYKDTEDILKEYNNEMIIINNSNKLLDMLDRIIINDGKLHIENNYNFEEFKKIVFNNFNVLYKKPTEKVLNRLNKELELINDMNYTDYFMTLLSITSYCKENNEPYLIEGYANNSFISYVLGITRIEPYNLPYELLYSNSLSINVMIDPKFYYKKLFKYINNKYNLIKCRFGFKIRKENVFRVIKNYEIKTHNYLEINAKDYISNNLIDIPLFNDINSNSFYLLPSNYITAYTSEGTIYDYHEFEDNLIKLQFIPNENIKYNLYIKLCNNKNVYDLFRSFDGKIIYFDELKYELENKPNLWFDDLVSMLANKYNLLIEDEVFNYLKSIKLDDVEIYNIINKLKESNKTIPKANLVNKSYLAYCYLYSRL